MHRHLLALSSAVVVAFTAVADTSATLEPKHFRVTRPIVTTSEGGIFRVDLPEDVYRSVTHEDLRDLRVFNASGQAVPASFRRTSGQSVLETSSRSLTFYPVIGAADKTYEGASRVAMIEDGAKRSVVVHFGRSTEGKNGVPRGYLVETGANEDALRRLELDFRDSDETGFFTVRAEGSDDLTSWQSLAAPATLARFRFGGNRLERKTIELGDVRYKYVLLTWTERPSLPLRGIRGEFAKNGWVEPQHHTLRVASRRESTRSFLFDKSAVPADRLSIQLPELNTLVRAELFSRADARSPWVLRTTGLLYRLRTDAREVSSEPMTFAPTTDRFWKLALVGNDASLGTGEPTLDFHWVAHQLFFVARGNGPFVLAYGQPRAAQADFGVGSVEAAFDANDRKFAPAVATLGPERTQEAAEPSAVTAATETGSTKRYLLWALLFGGILLTTLMAVKLLRDLKASG